MEVIHHTFPFRLPIPSEPDTSASGSADVLRGSVADLGDRTRREEELPKIGVEGAVSPTQPLQGHRGVLLFVVPVVGEHGREALV